MSSDLPPKIQLFVAEYLKDFHGQNAAIRSGYSKKSARVQAAALLSRDDVKAELDAAKVARLARVDMDSDAVLVRLQDEVEADIADLYDDNGALLPVEEWPLIWRQGLVVGVETETKTNEDGTADTVVTRVRFADRTRRLEMLGRHIKVNAFQDTVLVKGLDGLADRLARAADRAKVIDADSVVLPVSSPAILPGYTASPADAALSLLGDALEAAVAAPVLDPEPVPVAPVYRPVLPLSDFK
ncbi:terminase small subunit [Rhizobium sp. NPDC090275]|uniref:terminase small subunit n=1 Tax=Rhizobium sp. NPDC090275 TaxID=3364498 RepID=UPI00383B7501